MSSIPYQEVVPHRSARQVIRGIEYRIHEWGSIGDRLLVLLHGWGDTGASFQFLVDALRHDWFVVAPDWRGFGDSGRNAEAYWFPDYLADLHALLEHYSPQSAVPLLGHSMGGNVAALYAGVFPERVSALVNVEGFGLADSDPEQAPLHYRRWIEAGRERTAHPGYASHDELVPKIRKGSPRIDTARAQFIAAGWTGVDERGRVRLKVDPAHRWPNAVQYRRSEAEACWRRIRAPVLLVTGAESRFAAAAKQWRDPLTGAPFADAATLCIPEAGHMLHFEQPVRLAVAAEGFLRP